VPVSAVARLLGVPVITNHVLPVGELKPHDAAKDAVKSQDGQSTGAQTPPTGPRRPHNPWTLYLRPVPNPVTEDELREFFGDAVWGVGRLFSFAGWELIRILVG
jgi:hypothetical protein